MIDLVHNEDAWDALNEAAGRAGDKGKEKDHKPTWVPVAMDSVLEELLTWNLLSEIIFEVDEEIIRQQTITRKPPTLGSSSSFLFHRPVHNDTSQAARNGFLHQNMQPQLNFSPP